MHENKLTPKKQRTLTQLERKCASVIIRIGKSLCVFVLLRGAVLYGKVGSKTRVTKIMFKDIVQTKL